MGRRIFKKVYSGEILEKHLRFVYDGYKLIEEKDALNSNALVRRYVWQPESLDRDVPLTVYDASTEKTYYYHTDANKNVTELSDENGEVVAHYEYSPFGSLTKTTAAYAASNPFRFSSEYFDEETGLVYYNYRYYNPELGRWISRDPIEEQGGYNLYGMIGNNPLYGWDDLGRGLHEWWCTLRDLFNLGKKIKDTKDKLDDVVKTKDNVSTLADPDAPLDEKVKAVTDTAIDGAKKSKRNNDANNIQNFQNKSLDNLTEIQNSIDRSNNELRKLYDGTW